MKKYFILLLVLIFPINVNAWSNIDLSSTTDLNNYYIETGMNSLLRQNIYKCSAWGNCPTVGSVLYPSGPVSVNSGSTKLDSYGALYGFAINNDLQPDKVYSISYDFCSFGDKFKNISTDIALFSRGLGNTDYTQGDLMYHGTFQENDKYVMLGNSRSNACYRTYFTGSNFSGVALRSFFYTKNNNITHIALLGYNVSYIGEKNNLSSSQISNIVNSAVNNSTNSINSNINDMNNDIQNKIAEENNKVIENQNKNHEELISDSTDSPDSSFDEYNDKLASNGVITNLITLPIRLFTNILNNINGTCTSFSLGNLMGTDLTIPCLDISSYLGSNLWNIIDILFSGLFVLVIAKKMIKVFENFSSMREGDVIGD